MDNLDAEFYCSTKEALKKLQESIKNEDFNDFELPIVVINFATYETIYFKYSHEAKSYIAEREFESGEPAVGEAADYLILNHALEEDVIKYPNCYNGYEYWKTIDSKKIYRKKSTPYIEHELVLNVSL